VKIRHSKSSVNTLIPVKFVTDLELELLGLFGYQHQLDESDADAYYFYLEGPANEKEMTSDSLVDANKYFHLIERDWGDVEILINQKNSIYFNAENKLKSTELSVIFQNIIKRSDGDIECIEIETAHFNNKPVLGDFGGYAEVITSDNIISMGTAAFIRKTVNFIDLNLHV